MVDDVLVILVEQLYQELTEVVEGLGGSIDEFDPDNKIISITVAEDSQVYVAKVLEDLTVRYEKKKKELISSDPFFGVKAILSE